MPKLSLKQNKADTNELENRLRFDAIDNAEQVLGVAASSKSLMAVAIMTMQANSARKNDLLLAREDSTLSMNTGDYITVVEAEGFKQVLKLDIPAYGEGDRRVDPSEFLVYFKQDEAILLAFDTYMGQRNGGHFYFNWRPTEAYDITRHHISGCNGTNDLKAGSSDCREAIRLNIQNMRRRGNFLARWEVMPSLWLVHHGDRRLGTAPDGFAAHAYYDKIDQERLSMLPTYVQKAIGFTPAASKDGSIAA
jgi:hypothetical protein